MIIPRHLIGKYKTALGASLLLGITFTANAQDPDSAENNIELKSRPAHIGFCYPISTNGLEAASCSNGFSFHALVGVSGVEQSTVISGLAGIVKYDANGLMLSGLVNKTGGNMKGVQIAGLSNVAGGSMKGIAVAGLSNVSADLKGFQIAGLANISDDLSGFQASGLANVADIQKGLQLAGITNVAKKSKGLQLSGLVNVSTHADNQLAGLINIAKKVKGLQMAGLINIAEESDYPIGIINIIKAGEMQVGLSFDESGTSMATFRSGSKVLYGLIGAGFNYRYDEARYVLETGMGLRIPIGNSFRINTELASAALSDIRYNVYFRSSMRVLAEVRFAQRYSIFAGPALNYVGYDYGQADIVGNRYLWQERRGTHYNGFYLGLNGGIQFKI